MTAIVIILTMIIVAWLFFDFFGDKATMGRNLKKIPKTRIATCKDGDVVRLTGKAEVLSSIITAPLSKRKCIYYQVIVESSDADQDYWMNVVHDEKGVNFLIREDDNIAVISTYLVKSFIIPKELFQSGAMQNVSVFIEKYLNRFGKSSVGPFGYIYSIRYNENIIEVNEEVTVAGKVRWIPGYKVGLPDFEKVLYVKAVKEREPLYLTNDSEMFN